MRDPGDQVRELEAATERVNNLRRELARAEAHRARLRESIQAQLRRDFRLAMGESELADDGRPHLTRTDFVLTTLRASTLDAWGSLDEVLDIPTAAERLELLPQSARNRLGREVREGLLMRPSRGLYALSAPLGRKAWEQRRSLVEGWESHRRRER
ncbi:MAG: hypothetical protein AAF533_15875 [Acidobacteriota bacterium]